LAQPHVKAYNITLPSSAPVEFLFSLIATPYKNTLSSAMFERLLMFNMNSRLDRSQSLLTVYCLAEPHSVKDND